ncbi:hypothetical protein H9P43_010040 [Blastocladiella emersonii ATCC 22665]|nr:hypothetical protein H9P43_010040 [Blastocladiella emersonii ATCC 22665]
MTVTTPTAAPALAPSVPVPAADDIFAQVHATCAALAESRGLLTDAEAGRRFLNETLTRDVYDELVSASFRTLPLRFDSDLEHVNFLAVRALLNFGSGYRAELKALTGRGAWENIQFLLMAMHLDSERLDAKRLASISSHEVASLANLPTHVDAPTGMPGITMSAPSPAAPLIDLLTRALNDTGRTLLEIGSPSLGHFVMQAIGDSRRAARLVSALASTFPVFRDVAALPSGEPVYLLKKAQYLAMDLQHLMPHLDAVQWVDAADIGIPSDNVIPSVLVHLDIVVLPLALRQLLADATSPDGRAITVDAPTMAALRAASVAAIREITPHSPFEPRSTVVLGSIVWAWAKHGDNRTKIPRLTLKETCMF